MGTVKITVVRKLGIEDVYGEELPKTSNLFRSPCRILNEGEEFIVQNGQMPEGFCSWAWADIHRDITHLRFDGNYPWMKEDGVAYGQNSNLFRNGTYFFLKDFSVFQHIHSRPGLFRQLWNFPPIVPSEKDRAIKFKYTAACFG